MSKEVYRKEVKFKATVTQFNRLYQYLDNRMCLDENARDFDAYLVRSLYFDSYCNDDLNDTITGVDNRKKIRIRIYDCNQSYAQLEYKFKNSHYMYKKSLKLTKSQVELMLMGHYGFLLDFDLPLARTIYLDLVKGVYKPKVMAQFKRVSFVLRDSNIRITYDTGLKASKCDFDLFNENILFNDVMLPDEGVLEVKYTDILYSYLIDFVKKIDALPTAYSKYVMAMAM